MNSTSYTLGSSFTYTGLTILRAIERLRSTYDITTTTQDLLESGEVYKNDTPALVPSGMLTIDDDIFLNNPEVPVLAIYGLSLLHAGGMSGCQKAVDEFPTQDNDYKSKVFEAALTGNITVFDTDSDALTSALGISTYTP